MKILCVIGIVVGVKMIFELIMTGFSLTVANYSYQFITKDKDYGKAFMATYFQLSALVIFYIIHTLMEIRVFQ